MHRLAPALVLVAALGGCATSDAGGSADASALVPADAGVTDAEPSAADAEPAAIDAAPTTADAATADAAPGSPDAPPPDAPAPDAMPPDAMPPDAMPDACVPEWIGLLSNGNFEAGATAWTQVGGTLIRQYGAGYPWQAQDGTWAALLGGANNSSQELTQAAAVPANATALRLRGFLCFVTEETLAIEYDTLTVQIRGGVTEEYVWSNLDAGTTCAWTGFQLDAPTSHAGETVTLSFENSNDISNITSFGFDGLVLEAFACP